MSAISNLLNQIKTAIYGEEVRDSIHDAIEQCYTDVSNGKTLADTAAANANTATNAANAAASSANTAANAANTAASNIDSEINDLKSAVSKQIPMEREFTYAFDGRYVAYDSGSKIASSDFSVTNFIPLAGIKRIRYTRTAVTTSTPKNGMAFFSSNETSTYISGIPSVSNASEPGSEFYTVDVPEGANYAQFSWWSEALRETRGEFALYDADQYDESFIVSKIEQVKDEISDAVSDVENSVAELNKEINPVEREYSYALDGRYINYATGAITGSSNFSVTNFIPLAGVQRITYKRIKVPSSSPNHGMAFYSSNDVSSYISGIASIPNASESDSKLYTVYVPEGANYARFSWWSEALRETRGEFELYDADQYDDSLNVRVSTLEKTTEDGIGETALVADVPQNEGVQNAILTAHQFTDIMWTPVADMPGIYRDPATQEISYKTHKKGCRQKGIPYCSGNTYEQRVNDSISFDTFATAVKSQNSVLYTNSLYEEGLKKATYYGVACSKLVQACWGAPEFVDSQQIYSLPGIVKIADPGEFTVDDLQLGDGILNPQVHCTIVTGINRNTKGQVVSVEISEAVMPTCRRLTWTKGEFYEHFASYGLYRYPLIVNAQYRKARYIDLDDGITAPDDIPIAIKRGSYINMSTSNSFKAIVDNTIWTTLHDVVNGEDVTREISSTEITLPKNRIGYHEVYPTDANGNRGNSSFYFVYENTVSASVSEGYVTVTYTSNAPAVLIFFNSTSYEYIENDTGSVTVEIPTGATSCRILFRSEYGTFFSASMNLT